MCILVFCVMFTHTLASCLFRKISVMVSAPCDKLFLLWNWEFSEVAACEIFSVWKQIHLCKHQYCWRYFRTVSRSPGTHTMTQSHFPGPKNGRNMVCRTGYTSIVIQSSFHSTNLVDFVGFGERLADVQVCVPERVVDVTWHWFSPHQSSYYRKEAHTIRRNSLSNATCNVKKWTKPPSLEHHPFVITCRHFVQEKKLRHANYVIKKTVTFLIKAGRNKTN